MTRLELATSGSQNQHSTTENRSIPDQISDLDGSNPLFDPSTFRTQDFHRMTLSTAPNYASDVVLEKIGSDYGIIYSSVPDGKLHFARTSGGAFIDMSDVVVAPAGVAYAAEPTIATDGTDYVLGWAQWQDERYRSVWITRISATGVVRWPAQQSPPGSWDWGAISYLERLPFRGFLSDQQHCGTRCPRGFFQRYLADALASRSFTSISHVSVGEGQSGKSRQAATSPLGAQAVQDPAKHHCVEIQCRNLLVSAAKLSSMRRYFHVMLRQ